MKKRFIILDGSSLMYRAFYALPLLSSPTGEFTNAIYGFSNMLIKLLQEWKPDYLVIAFDKGKKTFRTEMFADYKGTRKPTPPELLNQIPLLHELAEAWGIAFKELAGYEADDIIGTLATKAVEAGCEAYIVTGDRDALQLIRPDLNVLFTKKGISEIKNYDVEAFQADYDGLSPEQLVDLKGLMGDNSDNIPGVPGVGPKTAIKLISAYSTVEEVLLHVEEIAGKKLKENIREYQEQALLSKRLAKICLEAPVAYEPDEFVINFDGKKLTEFYTRYSIRSMLRAIKPFVAANGIPGKLESELGGFGEVVANGKLAANEVFSTDTAAAGGETVAGSKTIVDSEEAAALNTSSINGSNSRSSNDSLGIDSSSASNNVSVGKAPKTSKTSKVNKNGLLFGLDREAIDKLLPKPETGISSDELVELAKAADHVYIAVDCGGKIHHITAKAAGIAIADKMFFMEPKDGCWQGLVDILADNSIKKYVHDLKRLYHAGLRVQGNVMDMELVGYLVNPVSNMYSLYQLTYEYCPYLPEPLNDWKQFISHNDAIESLGFDLVDPEYERFVIWQAVALKSVSPVLEEQLQQLELEKLYTDIELPLVEVLTSMEHTGIYLNQAALREQTVQAGKILYELEQEIYNQVGHKFNLNSPKQLGVVLFDELGLKPLKKTKTGYSTNAEVLEKLAQMQVHPILEKILAYRFWNKLKSTYLDGLANISDVATNRIHTTFNQTVTATGRLSSSDPNLQNIPVRTEEGKHIRQLFEPGEGYDYLLSADYSQIELRVLAAMSGDEAFIKAFNNGEDIHARTAAEVFGTAIEDVTPQMRRSAKAVNFGIVYGISDYGLSQDLNISRKEAASYIESYFAKCPGIKAFIDKTVQDAHANGMVKTMFGRRRDLPTIHSPNFNQRSLAERMAMNTPIQGTAADIIKLAMIRAYRAIKEAGLKSRILLQVHDELVMETVETEIPQLEKLLKDAMEQVIDLAVPLSIDIHWGKNWAEAK